MHIEFGSDIDSRANEAFINKTVDNKWLDNSHLFRSGRDCLKYIAKIEKECKIAFVPAICCESMAIPFKQYGVGYILYPLNKDYTINEEFVLNNIKEHQIILINNYLGLKTKEATIKENEFLDRLKQNHHVVIVRDVTQSLEEALYSDKSKDDYTIFSSRKWAGLPDSGVMWSNKDIIVQYDEPDFKYAELKNQAMKIKSEYLSTHDISIKQKFMELFKQAEEIIDNDVKIIEMSEFSKELLYSLDFEKILNIRKSHVKHFEEKLEEVNKSLKEKIKLLSKGTNCSGQYFPIYVNNQKELQKHLANNNIYCPVIWPMMEELDNAEFGFCNDLVSHMLAIPCDQRYSLEEIDYIIVKIME